MGKKAGHIFVPKSLLKTALINLCIFFIYTYLGKVGLSYASINPSTSAIWPPTGIALASILIFGYRVVPAIFFGAFAVNITTAGTIETSLAIALGNTLEGIVGAYLVNRFANGIHAFSSVVDIFKFVFFAAILSTTVSANIGTTTLLLGHLLNWQKFFEVWLTWWLGDLTGALIIAPLILVWATSGKIHFYFKETVHILLAFFVLNITTWIIFSGIMPYAYLCIPVAIWIAFWFGRRGASTSTIFVASTAVNYTIHGIGPFATGQVTNQSLLLVQLFIGILSITSLTFASLVHALRKGESTLASHDARFKALIEKSFEAVVLIDAASTILYATPSVKRVLGYAPEELIGYTGFNLVIPEDRPFTMRTLSKLVLKPGNSVTIQYRVAQKNKHVIWVEATGTNLLFDKEISAVVVNFTDITEKKTLEETMLREKTEDEAMLASIGDGIIATDNTGRITLVNRSACEIFGWKQKDVLGKLLIKIAPLEDETGKQIPITERPITKVLSLQKKMVTSRYYYYVREDKSKFPVRFRLTPLKMENRIVGTIEVFQDITKEKEIDRMKDEFISMASHELRTPMTAVNGLLSMIFHGDYGPINEKLKHPLDNIRISAERQIHLINDLLNVSRLQSGKIEFSFTNFPLKQVLDEAVKMVEPIARQKKLTLTVKGKEDFTIHADIEWSKHIINNLVGNALKFTDKGSVVISYGIKDKQIFISITDTGNGIEPTDQEKLFGKFQQLDGKDASKPPGSGLGLYLSRELARKMNGDVSLEKSILGKGSTFIITLPKAQQKAPGLTNQIEKKEIAIS
jgi:PAS domain S-box-containing protein